MDVEPIENGKCRWQQRKWARATATQGSVLQPAQPQGVVSLSQACLVAILVENCSCSACWPRFTALLSPQDFSVQSPYNIQKSPASARPIFGPVS